jgi:transposase
MAMKFASVPIIIDNWTVHHGHDITELVESFGCTICYLPTYSPDLNPIEYLVSKIKAVIKACRPSSIAELMDAFSKAILYQCDLSMAACHAQIRTECVSSEGSRL